MLGDTLSSRCDEWPSSASRCDGLLLVGHGTHDAAGISDFHALAGLIRQRLPALPVAVGFLELAQPTIREALVELAATGARRVVVAPVFLLAAQHVKRDVPAETRRAAAEIAGLEVRFALHLGCHPAVVELSRLRYREALAIADDWSNAEAVAETLLLFVGRGSSDAAANDELARLAWLRRQRQPVGHLEICYLEVSEPRLCHALEKVAALPFRRMVVQPHLLFRGQLVEQFQREAGAFAQSHLDRQCSVCGALGPHPLLAKAIIERAGAAAVGGSQDTVV